MQEVQVGSIPLSRLGTVLPGGRLTRLEESAVRAREAFGDRVIWHVNATAHGGGVAEMLQTLLAYGNGAGVENRWLVIDGDAEFFTITKRIHNRLHGATGDGGPLGEREHAHYEAVLAANLDQLRLRVAPRDLVMLHDPQTAGLREGLRDRGVKVIWRCHVGRDETNERTDEAWAFLRPYVEDADAFVFSRRVYAPEWVDTGRLFVIPPSIDPFAAKNTELAARDVATVVARAGLVSGGDVDGTVRFVRRDGSPGVGARPHPVRGARGRRRPTAVRRPAGGAGQPLGPPQGHARRDGGLRAAGGGRRLRRHPPDAGRVRR